MSLVGDLDTTVQTADETFIRRCYQAAEEVIQREQAYLKLQERLFAERHRARASRSLPVVAWCGWGRSGKDEAGEWLGKRSPITYPGGGCSMVATPLIATALGKPAEQCFKERHQSRLFWFHFLNGLRDLYSQTILVRMVLAAGDTVTGIRSKIELLAAQEAGYIEKLVWVHRPGVPKDVTVEYDELACQYAVINDGTLAEYHDKLRRLCGEKFFIPLQEFANGQEA